MIEDSVDRPRRAEAPLPAGLAFRPLTMADARAVYELMAADQRVHLGRVDIEEADIVGDWQRPSFDVPAQVVGVFEGDKLVGYAEAGQRGDAAVHPDLLGRGIGTWLAYRMQDMARDLGLSVVGMPVLAGSPADRLLAALGYRIRWTSWGLQLPDGAVIAARELPPGYAVREARQDGAELREFHGVLEDAFLEWSVRERESFDDFSAGVLARPGIQPWNLRVVTDPDGRIAAAAIVLVNYGDADEADDHRADQPPEAYVARLATRADQRGRGLAQALLVDSFAAARDHGALRCGLSTDSRTGALGLYERVGMRVVSTWVNRAIDL